MTPDAPPQDLIVFDGHCLLCSGLFRWVVAQDRQGRFLFATAQSDLGQRTYAALGLRGDHLDTMVTRIDGQTHLRLDAVAAVCGALGGRWRLLAALRFLPRWVKTPLYGMVARNRYRLFGRSAQCLLPAPELRGRFAVGGI